MNRKHLAVFFVSLVVSLLLLLPKGSTFPPCTSDAAPCDFSLGNGSCCYSMASVPRPIPHDPEGPKAQWIASTFPCGMRFDEWLFIDCIDHQPIPCGSAATQDCGY